LPDPLQLLGDSSCAADGQRDARAGRKIERAPIFVDCEPIRHQLHAGGTVQKHGPSPTPDDRRAALQNRQILRIE
jgi:hypothetical protein